MAGGQIKYSKPCFDKFREYILKAIPRKYKAGGKDILTQIDNKELEGLKTSIHKAEMLLNPIIGELKEERENIAEIIETENQRDYFKDRYNTEVLTVVSNFFKLVIEINEDIIPNEEVKANFYRSMESIKKDWKERVFKDFNNGDFTQFNKGERLTKQEHNAVHYALAYFFDCEAMGNRKYENQTQTQTESDLYLYSKGKRAPNTIRKALDELKPKGDKIFKINTLADIAGKDWRAKIIELSKCPKQLQTFLQNKHL